MTDTYSYLGDDVNIAEMPQGCVISNNDKSWSGRQHVIITSIKDAEALIASLQRMINTLEKTNEFEGT